MKVYTKIVIDIKSLRVVEYDSVEYAGPITLCKGGSQTTVSYDEKYNDRMANVAERQQDMSDQYFKFWETTGKPYEQAQIKANMELMPFEVATRKEEMATKRMGMGMMREEITAAKPVVEEYYKQALEGVDVGEEVQRARADVAQGLQESEAETQRTMSRLGMDVTSPAYAERMKATGMEKAKAIGGAMTQARVGAEEKRYGRLGQATQVFKAGVGGINH